MRPRVQVDKQSIKLSQIVVLPKGILDREIMTTPATPISLSPEQLHAILPAELANYRVLGGKCEILPLNLSFTGKELEESLLKEIIKRNNISEEDIRLTYLGGDIKMPGETPIEWGNFPKELGPGSRIFTLNAFTNGKKIYSARTKFKVEKKTTVAVLSKTMPAFQLLSKKDFTMKTMYMEEPSRDLVTLEPTGMAILTNLEEGTILRKKHIRLVHAVQKGSEVEVIYSSGNITVKAKAIAKQSGNPGEQIELKSKSSGTLLKGTITSKGLVEIE